jgi:hypothetical protein
MRQKYLPKSSNVAEENNGGVRKKKIVAKFYQKRKKCSRRKFPKKRCIFQIFSLTMTRQEDASLDLMDLLAGSGYSAQDPTEMFLV